MYVAIQNFEGYFLTPLVQKRAVSLLVYVFGVLAVVGVMLGLSHIFGQRHKERATGEPYEAGIVATGSARLRFSAKFYLVAIR